VSYVARVTVMPKAGISDPQGQTIERTLPALGFDGVSDVRMGKTISLAVNASSRADARARVEAMCERLLANPVIESYDIAMEDDRA
jgi:phosphoribosylformylglycinamidine synthase PurS subunit